MTQSLGKFYRMWKHLPDHGNIYWTLDFSIFLIVGTSARPWEYYLTVGKFSSLWKHFPDHGNIYLTVGIFTRPWENLPDHGNIAKTWDHLPGHGKIYLTEGISARLWEYLPDRKNICQNISRFSSQFLIFPWPWLLCFSVTWWDWPAATGPCFTGPSASTSGIIMYCTFYYCTMYNTVHCAKNSLNLCITTASVYDECRHNSI